MIRIVGLLVIVAFAFWAFYPRGSGGRGKGGYHELLRACRNDKQLADRLVDYELKRRPGITRDEAVRTALAAYRRDHQRG